MQSEARSALLIFVGPQNPANNQWAESFLETIGKYFPAVHIEAQFLDSAAKHITRIANAPVPHVLICFEENSKPVPSDSAQDPEILLTKIYRKLDPHITLLRVVDRVPDGKDSLHWIESGLTAFLKNSSSLADLDTNLKEIFGERFANYHVRLPRFNGQHKIQINVSSLEQALVAETLNVGQGGLFVRTVPRDIRVGDLIHFELAIGAEFVNQSSDENLDPISRLSKARGADLVDATLRGQGIVVWVRTMQEKPQQPEGFGMHFASLDPATTLLLETFVSAHGLKQYIPIS